MGYQPPQAPYPATPAVSGYPIDVRVTPAREESRLWGIPFIGIWVRAFLAIPHLFFLWILSLGVGLWMFLGWIAILVMGRPPQIAISLLREVMHRQNRVGGYILLLPGGYPPLELGAPSPVDTMVNVEGRTMNRLWGIPFLGIMVRFIIAIPHFIVLSLLGIVLGLTVLVSWIPILVNGRFPNSLASFYEMVYRYSTRLTAYLLLLPVPYPPFSLS